MEFIAETNKDDINKLISIWNKKQYNIEEFAKEFTIFDIDCQKNLLKTEPKTVSFGMSQKAMVTASSIELEGFMCCVQKEFTNSEGVLLEQSEFFVPSYGYDINTTLCAAAANLIINGIFS